MFIVAEEDACKHGRTYPAECVELLAQFADVVSWVMGVVGEDELVCFGRHFERSNNNNGSLGISAMDFVESRRLSLWMAGHCGMEDGVNEIELYESRKHKGIR